MVRLEKQGDSFVMITGKEQKLNIEILVNALSELQKPAPDKNKIREGVLYVNNSAGNDLKNELRAILEKGMEKKELTITDL